MWGERSTTSLPKEVGPVILDHQGNWSLVDPSMLWGDPTALVERRNEYMACLEAASKNENIKPLAAFVVERVASPSFLRCAVSSR